MSQRFPTILLLVALLVPGCNRATAASVQASPDGTMTFATSVNQSKADPARYLCVVVDIRDSAGKTLHHEVTPASNTQRWPSGGRAITKCY
jgi:hypothetical protein